MDKHTDKPRQIVKSMKLANYLLAKGFPINEIRRNRQDVKNVVYFFENSPALQEAIDTYLEELEGQQGE